MASREEFAEAILSAYTDEKFLRGARARIKARLSDAQRRRTSAEQEQAEFDKALEREGLTLEEDSSD